MVQVNAEAWISKSLPMSTPAKIHVHQEAESVVKVHRLLGRSCWLGIIWRKRNPCPLPSYMCEKGFLKHDHVALLGKRREVQPREGWRWGSKLFPPEAICLHLPACTCLLSVHSELLCSPTSEAHTWFCSMRLATASELNSQDGKYDQIGSLLGTSPTQCSEKQI